MINRFQNNHQIAENIGRTLFTTGIAYHNSLELGEALGYNQDSSRNLGYLSGANTLLSGIANTIQDRRKQQEIADRYNNLRMREYEDISIFPSFKKGGMTKKIMKKLEKYELGGTPISTRGVYDFSEVVVPTDGSITMNGVNRPVLGISLDTGEEKVMMPNKDYFFNNTNLVFEKLL